MIRRKKTHGTCCYCGRELTKNGLTKHLKTCPDRLETQAEANRVGGPSLLVYHLSVQDLLESDYWLHLEMRGDSTLEDLDDYLRAIWLECCGHLSSFWIDPNLHTQLFDDVMGLGNERLTNPQVQTLFEPGMKIPYDYDFGITSRLLIKVLFETTKRPISAHPIELMARNIAPEFSCQYCDESAAHLCLECQIESETTGLLCELHEADHDCYGYGDPAPLVNSPRVGMCAYVGPAEAPY